MSRMSNHAGGLVDDQQVFVLKSDIQLDGLRQHILRGRVTKEYLDCLIADYLLRFARNFPVDKHHAGVDQFVNLVSGD